MYNLTQKQAREFLHTTIKHLMVFKDDSIFGWQVTKRDDKQMIEIKTNLHGTRNSIKSYPCALNDGKINFFKNDDSSVGGRETLVFVTHSFVYLTILGYI